MNTPLAFVSFDYELSETEKDRFLAEKANCDEPFDVDNWSSAPRSPRDDWMKMIHSRIGRCDFMIVLVAEGMETARVEEEILESKRCNVPFFGVYLGDAKRGTALPEGLSPSRTLPWDWKRIGLAVRQISTEGKHHVFR